MPVRRVWGASRPLLRDLPAPVGAGAQRAAGRGGTPLPSCPRRRGRPSRLRPDPRPGAGGTCPAGPRRSALPPGLPGLLPARAWAAGPGSAGPCPRGSLGARRAGCGLAGTAGGRGSVAGPRPAACGRLSYSALALCVPCLFTAPCCGAAARSARGRLLVLFLADPVFSLFFNIVSRWVVVLERGKNCM